MSVAISSSLSVKNETDIRGQAILALIRQFITFADGYYGFKSLGSKPEIRFPVVFVEPKSQVARMVTTGKFEIRITYAVYWYVRDSKAADVIALSTFIGEALIKLFSNNAIGDLGVANPPSNKFKQYANPGGGYYWLDSELKGMDWSVNYLNPETAPNLSYERSGRLMVEIMDVILK